MKAAKLHFETARWSPGGTREIVQNFVFMAVSETKALLERDGAGGRTRSDVAVLLKEVEKVAPDIVEAIPFLALAAVCAVARQLGLAHQALRLTDKALQLTIAQIEDRSGEKLWWSEAVYERFDGNDDIEARRIFSQTWD